MHLLQSLLVSAVFARQYQRMQSISFYGNDIKYVDVPFDQCAAQCDSTGGCVGYATNLNNKKGCWLKHRLTDGKIDSNYDGYVLHNAKSYIRIENFDYPGTDLKYFEGDKGKCFDECEKTRSCIGFSIKKSGVGCWLKSKLENGAGTSLVDIHYLTNTPTKKIYVRFRNHDSPLSDLKFFKTSNPDSCSLECDKTALCVAFNWNNINKDGCWLKHNVDSGYSNSNYDLYYPKSFGLNVKRHYLEATYSDFHTPSIKYLSGTRRDCEIACADTPECLGITFHADGANGCWLKSNLDHNVYSSTKKSIRLRGSSSFREMVRISRQNENFVSNVRYSQKYFKNSTESIGQCLSSCKYRKKCFGVFVQLFNCDKLPCGGICGTYDQGDGPWDGIMVSSNSKALGGVWLNPNAEYYHKVSADGQNFVKDIPYTQFIAPSDTDYLSESRDYCNSNPVCTGFFEQTHLCPEPARNDKKTDPNVTPGKGCYRVVGFFDKGPDVMSGTFVKMSNVQGSIYMKSRPLIPIRVPASDDSVVLPKALKKSIESSYSCDSKCNCFGYIGNGDVKYKNSTHIAAQEGFCHLSVVGRFNNGLWTHSF